jgi:GNAT superfamily N-acetyltransferase
VTFHLLIGPKAPGWRRLMALYARTFDARQRETESGILANLTTPERPKQGGHLVLAASDAGDSVIGGAIFSYLPSVDSGYASYVFVDDHLRGRGLGSRLLNEMERALNDQAAACGRRPVHGLFAEVQRATPGDAAAYTRFRFWRRNGVFPLGVDWHYPSLQHSLPAVPTHLAFGSTTLAARPWYPAELADAAKAIFSATYDYLPRASQTLALILEGLRSSTPDQPVPYVAWPQPPT